MASVTSYTKPPHIDPQNFTEKDLNKLPFFYKIETPELDLILKGSSVKGLWIVQQTLKNQYSIYNGSERTGKLIHHDFWNLLQNGTTNKVGKLGQLINNLIKNNSVFFIDPILPGFIYSQFERRASQQLIQDVFANSKQNSSLFCIHEYEYGINKYTCEEKGAIYFRNNNGYSTFNYQVVLKADTENFRSNFMKSLQPLQDVMDFSKLRYFDTITQEKILCSLDSYINGRLRHAFFCRAGDIAHLLRLLKHTLNNSKIKYFLYGIYMENVLGYGSLTVKDCEKVITFLNELEKDSHKKFNRCIDIIIPPLLKLNSYDNTCDAQSEPCGFSLPGIPGKEYFDNERNYDIIISVEGKTIYLHRVILLIYSDIIEYLPENLITIKIWTYQTVYNVLGMLYGIEIVPSDCNLLECYQFSLFLNIVSLSNVFAEKLMRSLEYRQDDDILNNIVCLWRDDLWEMFPQKRSLFKIIAKNWDAFISSFPKEERTNLRKEILKRWHKACCPNAKIE